MIPTDSRAKGMILNADQAVTILLNRTMWLPGVKPFFHIVSMLGNGRVWYALMIALSVLQGTKGMLASAHMLMAAALNLMLYRRIKSHTRRLRPFNACQRIVCGTAALDEFSFPSGHTLHAVSFTIIAAAWFPATLAALLILTTLIAVSRVVLGLHYPTDVLLGALLGGVVASLSLLLVF